jgi:hypothetical protein
MAISLLDLPPEIRSKIYLLLLTSSNPIPLTHTTQKDRTNEVFTTQPTLHPLFPLKLLLTCHQLYHEVRPLYFSSNAFSLTLVRNTVPLDYFLEPSFRDNRRAIKSLRLVISRWGNNDFFVKRLAPVLSDMILNGNLRDLEVQALRHHLFHHRSKGEGLEFLNLEAVKKLRTILEDPYLERVVLKSYSIMDDNLCYRGNTFEGLIYRDETHLIKRSSMVIR